MTQDPRLKGICKGLIIVLTIASKLGKIFVENKRIKPQRIDRNGKLNNSLRKFSHIHFLDIRKI